MNDQEFDIINSETKKQKAVDFVKKNKKILVLAHGTEIPKQYKGIVLNALKFKKNRIIKSYKNVFKIIANSNYTRDLMNASLKIDFEKIKVNNVSFPPLRISKTAVRMPADPPAVHWITLASFCGAETGNKLGTDRNPGNLPPGRPFEWKSAKRLLLSGAVPPAYPRRCIFVS